MSKPKTPQKSKQLQKSDTTNVASMTAQGRIIVQRIMARLAQ